VSLCCWSDWSRERFTLDQGLSDAVAEAFVQLADKGKCVAETQHRDERGPGGRGGVKLTHLWQRIRPG
jgi:valyl-tRNA synthetase